jgi:hypothetical protein
MIGGHPPQNMCPKECNSFHALLGTQGFSRPRHDSSTPSSKKEQQNSIANGA